MAFLASHQLRLAQERIASSSNSNKTYTSYTCGPTISSATDQPQSPDSYGITQTDYSTAITDKNYPPRPHFSHRSLDGCVAPPGLVSVGWIYRCTSDGRESTQMEVFGVLPVLQQHAPSMSESPDNPSLPVPQKYLPNPIFMEQDRIHHFNLEPAFSDAEEDEDIQLQDQGPLNPQPGPLNPSEPSQVSQNITLSQEAASTVPVPVRPAQV